jgi:hypothetical protein
MIIPSCPQVGFKDFGADKGWRSDRANPEYDEQRELLSAAVVV